jgi:hypothetical protein
MFIRRFGAAAGLLLFASVGSGQTDRAAQAERQKTPDSPQQKDSPGRDNPGDTLAALRGARQSTRKRRSAAGRFLFPHAASATVTMRRARVVQTWCAPR